MEKFEVLQLDERLREKMLLFKPWHSLPLITKFFIPNKLILETQRALSELHTIVLWEAALLRGGKALLHSLIVPKNHLEGHILLFHDGIEGQTSNFLCAQVWPQLREEIRSGLHYSRAGVLIIITRNSSSLAKWDFFERIGIMSNVMRRLSSVEIAMRFRVFNDLNTIYTELLR